MFGWFTLHVASLILIAALFGGMLFFMAVFTPLVFARLPKETAGPFLRSVFPVYYRIGGILALLSAVPLAPAHAYIPEIVTLVLVAAGFITANSVLRPAAERARDAGNESRFRLIHRSSVLLNLVQFAAVTVILIRLAQ